MLEELKQQVWQANLELERTGLIKLTWGNVSGIDRKKGLFVIKPSGVAYQDLRVEHMVVVDLEGQVAEGTLNPSSDTPTHMFLYRSFPKIGGITHTHSIHATMFAQACKGIPCFGTTHADHFFGTVPITRPLSEDEVQADYELNTGKVIVEKFAKLDPVSMPAVLVANHGPFTWGKHAGDSVVNSIALETVAEMARGTLSLNNGASQILKYLLDKHYLRKHGQGATYGQKKV
jgi:L-ribulose-5-phosphate 4-epimerase